MERLKPRTCAVVLGGVVVLLLLVLLLVLRDKTDVKDLHGEWKVISVKERGRPSQEEITGVVFRKEKVFLTGGTGTVLMEFAYHTDKHRSQWIDFVAPNSHLQGVYALDGDILRISLNESSDARAKGSSEEAAKVVFVLQRSSPVGSEPPLYEEVEDVSGRTTRRPVPPDESAP